MLTTDVGDDLWWWQLWDVGERFFTSKRSPTSLQIALKRVHYEWYCGAKIDSLYNNNSLFGSRRISLGNFVNVAKNPKYDHLWKLTSNDTIECPVYSCRDTVDIQEFIEHGNSRIFWKVKVEYTILQMEYLTYPNIC